MTRIESQLSSSFSLLYHHIDILRLQIGLDALIAPLSAQPRVLHAAEGSDFRRDGPLVDAHQSELQLLGHSPGAGETRGARISRQSRPIAEKDKEREKERREPRREDCWEIQDDIVYGVLQVTSNGRATMRTWSYSPVAALLLRRKIG